MSTREERIAVFEDTMSWIESDPELSRAVKDAKAHSEVFYEDNYPQFDTGRRAGMEVSVTRERSFESAMRLSKENPGAKIAVHNFANAFHPGGGVTGGSSAQEECLCRTSTLYPVINSHRMRSSYYKHHYDLNTPRASDSLIYSEGILILKTDEDLPRRMARENWVTVDVITLAAPDLRQKSNRYEPLVGDGTYMKDAELFEYHVKRANHMLTCAAAKGANILVLGAFGCGAFENNPNIVAGAYKSVLAGFPPVFDKIVFAVFCSPRSSANYDAFKKTLG
ncbi:MAG: TIGR02452 family protein [Clostridiales bacterium]|nr:TIGR02452 family protein [Clostridiales bacterium]